MRLYIFGGMIPRGNRGFRRYDAWVRSTMPINCGQFVGSQFSHEAGPDLVGVVSPTKVVVTRGRSHVTRNGGRESRIKRMRRRFKKNERGRVQAPIVLSGKKVLLESRLLAIAFKNRGKTYARKEKHLAQTTRDRNVSNRVSRGVSAVIRCDFVTGLFRVRKEVYKVEVSAELRDDILAGMKQWYGSPDLFDGVYVYDGNECACGAYLPFAPLAGVHFQKHFDEVKLKLLSY
jgi:hypothetical protein